MRGSFKACTWIIVGLILISLGGQNVRAQTVTRGPYLQSGTSTGIVVRWRTDQATDSAVYYGATPGSLTSSVSSAAQTTEHEVEISGLAPDTKYYYAVGTTGATLQGGDASHAFTTAPTPGVAKSTRLWVVGDSGTADANAAAVRDAYQSYSGADATDLWLMLGDNAYPDGTDAQYQSAVFDMYPTMLRQVVLWPTLGNHDGHTADSATQSGAYYEIFTLPTNAEAGGVASGTEAYYSFDYGNIHIICLESYETDRSPSGAMFTWLENDLIATDKEWIIAFWHHPPYTKGSHDSDTESRLIDMRQNALPILEAYGVDLVLSGHSHSYERSFLLDGHYGVSSSLTAAMLIDNGDGREDGSGAYNKSTGLIPNEGAVYAVAGSSGKKSGGTLNHPAMLISLNQLGSMAIDISGNRLDAVFINETGAVQDYFTIVKGPDTMAPVLEVTNAPESTTVAVTFSERVDAGSAETIANYGIDNGIAVTQAVLQSDERTVHLSTSTLAEGITYTLTVNNVQDLAGNTIAANSQDQFTFVTVVTKSFQDGVAPTTDYAGTRDTYLSQNAPDANAGNSLTLLIDGDDPGGSGLDLSTLIAWDVSDIPADALIESATLTLHVTDASSGVYGIYEVKRDWRESEATWNAYATGSTWAVPGALGAGDRGATSLGQIAASATGSYTTPLNAAGVALIQEWVVGAAQNYGFILADPGTGNGLDFTASDDSAPSNRPTLTITYSLPPSGDDVTPPSSPSNLSVQNVSTNTVSIAWDPATDDVGVVGYKVYRDGLMVDTTTLHNYDDSGLSPATAYDYEVTAFDAANNESLASNQVTATTDAIPTPTVSVSDVAVQLKNAGKQRRYGQAQVTVVDGTAQPVSNAVVSGVWSGLVNETVSASTGTDGVVVVNSSKVSQVLVGQFVYTVTSVVLSGYDYDPAANVESSDCMDTDGVSCASGPGGPPTPTNLTASAGASDIVLEWDDSPAPDVNSYRVYRSMTPGADYAEIAMVSTNAYTDTTAVAGVTYHYVVTAIDNADLESGFSNEASATVGGLPVEAMRVTDIGVLVIADRKHWRGEAVVVVGDDSGAPLADADVTGEWVYEPVGGAPVALGSGRGVTDATGETTIVSTKQRAATGDVFRFTVTGVSRIGSELDSDNSVLTAAGVTP